MTVDAARHASIRPLLPAGAWGRPAIAVALVALAATFIVACTPPHEIAPTPRPTLASIHRFVWVARRS